MFSKGSNFQIWLIGSWGYFSGGTKNWFTIKQRLILISNLKLKLAYCHWGSVTTTWTWINASTVSELMKNNRLCHPWSYFCDTILINIESQSDTTVVFAPLCRFAIYFPLVSYRCVIVWFILFSLFVLENQFWNWKPSGVQVVGLVFGHLRVVSVFQGQYQYQFSPQIYVCAKLWFIG